MGVIFGWIYTRTKRVMPLVVAHAPLLDVVAFVGYALLAGPPLLAVTAHRGHGQLDRPLLTVNPGPRAEQPRQTGN